MPTMRTIKFLHKVTIIVPLYLLIVGVVAILAVELEHLQNIHLVRIILAILLLYTTAHIIRVFIFVFGNWVVARTARNFTPETQFNRYVECKQLSHSTGEKRDHIVLLLHGFTTSPMEWSILAQRLNQEKIDFHAPLIYGFGQINHDFILALRKEDWFRQIVDIYDLFDERYEKVSVIGHSLGGMLACYLAQIRPIHELIISAPALFPQKRQGFYARIVKNRLATSLVSWLFPMILKPSRSDRAGPADTMDTETTYRYFQYLVAPTRLLIAMLQSQLEIRLDSMDCRRLTLMYGTHDITVDNGEIESFLNSLNLPFQRFRFYNSAHNIFLDFDREYANDLIVTLIRDELGHPDNNHYDYKRYVPSATKGVE